MAASVTEVRVELFQSPRWRDRGERGSNDTISMQMSSLFPSKCGQPAGTAARGFAKEQKSPSALWQGKSIENSGLDLCSKE